MLYNLRKFCGNLATRSSTTCFWNQKVAFQPPRLKSYYIYSSHEIFWFWCNHEIFWFWCNTYLMKSATMRYFYSGVISHDICNHEVFWFWCNIPWNLQPWDILILNNSWNQSTDYSVNQSNKQGQSNQLINLRNQFKSI